MALEETKNRGNRVGPFGIVLTTVYLIVVSILLMYGLVRFWPESNATERDLLLIVTMAGALGALVHSLRSLYWYVGNREFARSWIPMYVLLPFVGSSLALVFYLIIRGGFFSGQASLGDTSHFGFAALAGLVGLFSEQAVLRLKKVAENVFDKSEKGADHVPHKGEQ